MDKPDLTGKKFGKLTVIRLIMPQTTDQGEKEPEIETWECQCECGKPVLKTEEKLRGGDTLMCRSCAAAISVKRAREFAGFVDGTQLSRIRNMKAPSVNTSGVRGVYLDRRSGKWRARLRFKGKLMNFGAYPTFEEAVEARKKAEEEYFGPLLADREDKKG